jgi:hypothetical protein
LSVKKNMREKKHEKAHTSESPSFGVLRRKE